MPISENELKEALNRASSLMSKEGQQRINTAAKMNSNNYDNDGGFRQPTESQNMRNIVQESRSVPRQNSHSTLPKVIQDSILKNPIDSMMLEHSVSERSVLDSMNYVPVQKKPQQVVQENMVHETYSNSTPQYYQQPHYASQPMTIDYNYIRMIVNECVQANLKQIKEEILNESSLKAIRIGGENKIQLIDTKNNLYESKLEYKKNLSKK